MGLYSKRTRNLTKRTTSKIALLAFAVVSFTAVMNLPAAMADAQQAIPPQTPVAGQPQLGDPIRFPRIGQPLTAGYCEMEFDCERIRNPITDTSIWIGTVIAVYSDCPAGYSCVYGEGQTVVAAPVCSIYSADFGNGDSFFATEYGVCLLSTSFR